MQFFTVPGLYMYSRVSKPLRLLAQFANGDLHKALPKIVFGIGSPGVIPLTPSKRLPPPRIAVHHMSAIRSVRGPRSSKAPQGRGERGERQLGRTSVASSSGERREPSTRCCVETRLMPPPKGWLYDVILDEQPIRIYSGGQ